MRRRRILLGGILFLALLAGVLALGRRSDPIQLPDGSRIERLGVTYGQTIHRRVAGGWWDGLRFGWVPSSWFDLCGLPGGPGGVSLQHRVVFAALKRTLVVYPGTNALVVWLRHSPAPASAYAAFQVLAVDDTGAAYGVPSSGAQKQVGTQNWIAAGVSVFNRQHDKVRLRLFALTNSVWHPLADFTVPNPAVQTASLVAASGATSTQVQAGYEFTLAGLSTSLSADRAGGFGTTAAEFRFARDGRESTAWMVEGLDIEDGTGNFWNFRGFSRSGHRIIRVDGSLPADQPLKVRARFLRQGDFEPEMIWRIDRVSWPASNQYVTLTNIVSEKHGLTVECIGISAPGVKFPGANVGSSGALVHFRVAAPAGATGGPWGLLLADVLDESGRSLGLPQHPFRLQLSPGSGIASTPVSYPPNLARGSLVIAWGKPETVEFITRISGPKGQARQKLLPAENRFASKAAPFL